MKHQKSLLSLAFLTSAALTSTAQASLFDRGNGMIYDDVSDITFASDANLFQTQGASNANLVNTIISDTPSTQSALICRMIAPICNVFTLALINTIEKEIHSTANRR